MMIIGVGADILDIDRLRRNPADLDPDAPFLVKTFTVGEQQASLFRRDRTSWLATRFAGKEAVFKALGTGDGRVRLNEIEILAGADGLPLVSLTGRMKLLADMRGVTDVHVTLSLTNDYAIAFAIMQRRNNQEEYQ